MKSLLRVIFRYMGTAVLMIIFILVMNVCAFLYAGYQTMQEEKQEEGMWMRKHLAAMGEEMRETDGVYDLTRKGYELLEKTGYVWAMLVDGQGQVVWEWQVPSKVPRSYTMADVSVLSKWYIADYPVKTWTYGDGFMVYAMDKERVMRVNGEFSLVLIDSLPQNLLRWVVLNISLIVLLVTFLGYRFYRSLRPIAAGIESLSRKESVELSESGITGELAQKFNQTSRILSEQDRRLSKRDNARTSWIAGVSHDIRTPLSLIAGYSIGLSQDKNLSDEQRKKLLIIQSQSMTIKRLIEDLNLTSKLEFDAQPLRISRYSPASLLREIVVEYYNNGLEDQYEIYLSVQESVEAVTALGDVGLLKRCFQNIIGNSIRHNENGCFINLRVTRIGDSVHYLFQDSGPGINEKILKVLEGAEEENLKDPHVMGLLVVRQIVLAHKGTLHFEKRPSGNYDILIALSPYALSSYVDENEIIQYT